MRLAMSFRQPTSLAIAQLRLKVVEGYIAVRSAKDCQRVYGRTRRASSSRVQLACPDTSSWRSKARAGVNLAERTVRSSFNETNFSPSSFIFRRVFLRFAVLWRRLNKFEIWSNRVFISRLKSGEFQRGNGLFSSTFHILRSQIFFLILLSYGFWNTVGGSLRLCQRC